MRWSDECVVPKTSRHIGRDAHFIYTSNITARRLGVLEAQYPKWDITVHCNIEVPENVSTIIFQCDAAEPPPVI